MKRRTLTATLVALLVAMLPLTLQAKVTHLLPKPHKVNETKSTPFALNRAITINDATNSALLRSLFTTYGCEITAGGAPVNVQIVSSIDGTYDYDLDGFENESYTLTVTTNAINITAVTPTGVIRAAQTLAQLAEGYAAGSEAIETVEIKDWAAFKLRGYMHDVGRSFISIEELKKHIDLLSRFKVNCFHWHFTENQAWRFEVVGYPQLTADSTMTRFAGKYYTQEQCRDVAAYAKERGVIVIPEIDMPGHSDAFDRAMGFSMQTDQGVKVLLTTLTQVADVFSDAPYIHIGADEESITYPNFLQIMNDTIHNLGKKVVVWNPIRGVSINSNTADMTQMWSSSGAKVGGIPNIDCRYNYTNHFDVFADVVGIYRSNIYYVQQGNSEVAGTISAYWNDRKTPTESDIVKQNNMYANVIASAERAWIGGGKQYIETGGTMLPNSGEEFDEFADWERRFLFHKANSLKNEPIPYVKQTNVRWRITDAFPNNGDASAIFPPEEAGKSTSTELMAESFTHDGVTYYTGMATGAGIYLRHTWGNSIIPTYYGSTNYENRTAYAWTYVYSPTEQEVGAQIEFQNYGRSENDKAPDNGNWDRKGSNIWINGVRVNPPTWTNAGKSIGSEVDLGNENFSAREPVVVTLKAGWNKVFIKLPYVGANGVRLNKWLFTCVFTDKEGKNAVESLIYSPNQCKDDATEQVAAKISQMKRDRGAYIGTAIGLWPESAAQAVDAKIQEIEATYSATMTADERAAQINALEQVWAAFTASLTNDNMNKPVDGHYYRMYTPLRANRYATGNGANEAITGPTEATTKASIWKFESRGDGSYNIINLADGTYITTSGSPLKCVTSAPSAGWTIKKAETIGNVIVVSGSAQFNQQKDGSFHLLNWGSGTNTTDDGCEYRFIDITNDLAPQPFALIEQLGDATFPYAIADDVAAKIFSKKNITIAIDLVTPASMSGRQALVCAADPTKAPLTSAVGTGASPYVAAGLNGSKLAYLTSSRSGDVYTGSTALNTSTAYKIVYVFDKDNNTFSSYINGTLSNTNALGNSFQDFAHIAANDATKDNAKIYVGAGVVNSTATWDAFAGRIRSVQFFDEALNQTKISQIEYPATEEDVALNNAIEANANFNIYGLQRFYGLVKNAGTGIAGDGQFICNYPAATSQESGNAYANLIDGNYTTFFHSGYGSSIGEGSHYLQANLNSGVKSWRFYFKKRSQNDNNRPTKITIQGSTDGNAWENITVISSGFPTTGSVLDYYSEAITTETAYKYLRFTVNSTNNNTVFYTFSEFYILPNNAKVAEAFDAVRAYRTAQSPTAEQATALNNAYAWNKGLTEGSPIVGHEHYIYVDTYKDGAFLNRYLYNNSGTLSLSTTLQRGNDNYTWTAAVESDGKYNFANKTGKYLAHKGMSNNKHNFVVAASTHHAGVTLHTPGGGNYFVIKNADGGFDQSSVTYDQTSTNYCTDFVFIPVDAYLGSSLTIESNIANTNAVYSWNSLEFTNNTMFDGESITSPALSVVSCNPTYRFVGFYSDEAYSVPVTEINELNADKVIYAKFELAIFSATYGEKKVRVRMVNDNNYTAGIANATNFDGAAGTTHPANLESTRELWYFVGTADGFKLQNEAAGSAYALNVSATSEGTAATMAAVANATTWKLVKKTSGYAIVPSSNANMTLNAYGGKGYNIKLYGAGDTGGWWNFEIVGSLTMNFIVDGTQPLPTNTRIAEVTYSYDGTSANSIIKQGEASKTFYLPIGTKFTLTQPWLYRGYTHAGFFNGDETTATDFTNYTLQDDLVINAKYGIDTENKYQYLFWYRKESTNAPYRIPAITVTKSGKVIAISDYRTCGDDIGMGEVDIMFRRSTESYSNWDGISWTEEDYVADGQGGNSNVFNVGFGDAAVVSDRESNKTLVMAVAGKQRFNWASSTSHNSVARIVTIDDGDTWEISDVTTDFLGDEDALFPTAYSLFLTSGRLLQSSYKKEGAEYYRIYGVVVLNDNGDNSYPNYVVYSDNFGESWSILGGIENGMACSAGNETKVEELPNGDIMVSVRRGGGRYFNVFSFTDKANGEGSWDNVATSNFGASDCNGELMRVGNVLLQSIPKRGYQGKDRSNVAIYYKVIEDKDYTSAEIATGWAELIQVSYIGSAYSTMTLLPDGKTIGFLYEEDPDNGTFAYNIVYVPIDLAEVMPAEVKAAAFPAPKSEKFYRLQGRVSGNYMNAANPYNATSGQMSMIADGTTATTIFYLTAQSKLLSYSEGTYTNGTRCIGGIGAGNGQTIEFRNAESGNYNYFTLHTDYSGAAKYVYDNNNRVDRNTNYAPNNCDWKVIEVKELPVTVGSTGYSTLYAPVALEIPAEVTAYTAVRNGEYIDLTAIEGGVIPANTAVILKAAQGTYNLAITKSEDAVADNVLDGTIEKVATSSIENPYTLQSDASADNGIVLRRYNGTHINGFKMYLSVSDAAEALFFRFNGTTDIENIAEEAASKESIYDLFGRKVNNPVKGIFISNNKKVIY